MTTLQLLKDKQCMMQVNPYNQIAKSLQETIISAPS